MIREVRHFHHSSNMSFSLFNLPISSSSWSSIKKVVVTSTSFLTGIGKSSISWGKFYRKVILATYSKPELIEKLHSCQ